MTLQSVNVGNRDFYFTVCDVDAVMQMYIDAGQGDRDPYWTCLWPSSIAMAQELLQRPELVAGKKVADLGCGLGLGGVAAGIAGAAEVVFLDREKLALQCSLLNALLCGLPVSLDGATADAAATLAAQSDAPKELIDRLLNANNTRTIESTTQAIRVEVFDWSQPLSSLLGYFDIVIACDVLYEAFSVEPVATVSPKLLKPNSRVGGEAILLADPPLRAKQNRDRFLELVGGDQGFVAAEWSQKQARVFEESENSYKNVPIEFMILKRGSSGDTVGVKFYTDDGY